MRILLLVVLALLMQAAGQFAPPDIIGSGPAATTLASGFLLLWAILAGSLFQRIGLPKLTAYLVAGVLAGPGALDLLSTDMVAGVELFRGMTVPFVALLAGTELSIAALRPLRGVVWLALASILCAAGALFVTAFLGHSLLPAAADVDTTTAIALSLVLAVALSVSSPLCVIALLDETDADGPLSRTVLAVSALGSLLVVVLFAVASAVAHGMVAGPASALKTAGVLTWTALGSVGTGVALGLAFSAYLRRFQSSAALFAAAAALVAAELAPRVHLDPLVLALSAGIFLRNATDFGPRLRRELRTVSLPIYVAFFAVAGASVPLVSFSNVGLAALALVAARAAGVLVGWRAGSAAAGASGAVRRWGGIGLLPQADLALGLGLLAADLFPALALFELFVAVVALNELLAPILFRIGLAKSGEVGARSAVPDEEDIVAVDLSGPVT